MINKDTILTGDRIAFQFVYNQANRKAIWSFLIKNCLIMQHNYIKYHLIKIYIIKLLLFYAINIIINGANASLNFYCCI